MSKTTLTQADLYQCERRLAGDKVPIIKDGFVICTAKIVMVTYRMLLEDSSILSKEAEIYITHDDGGYDSLTTERDIFFLGPTWMIARTLKKGYECYNRTDDIESSDSHKGETIGEVLKQIRRPSYILVLEHHEESGYEATVYAIKEAFC